MNIINMEDLENRLVKIVTADSILFGVKDSPELRSYIKKMIANYIESLFEDELL